MACEGCWPSMMTADSHFKYSPCLIVWAGSLSTVDALCRPVDFVAESIIGISSAQRKGLNLYHMVNPYW
jgi:hypothetical protein